MSLHIVWYLSPPFFYKMQETQLVHISHRSFLDLKPVLYIRLTLRMKMGNVSNRQQTDQRAENRRRLRV